MKGAGPGTAGWQLAPGVAIAGWPSQSAARLLPWASVLDSEMWDLDSVRAGAPRILHLRCRVGWRLRRQVSSARDRTALAGRLARRVAARGEAGLTGKRPGRGERRARCASRAAAPKLVPRGPAKAPAAATAPLPPPRLRPGLHLLAALGREAAPLALNSPPSGLASG